MISNKNAGTSQIYTTALRVNLVSSGVHSDASPLVVTNCFSSDWLRVNYESSGVRSDESSLVVTKLFLLLLAVCQLCKQRGAL